ncbi:MAG: hypothetical protein IT450_16800 [Phycisphaerales bacterium]|nr:hypothetical protein [Phycisphaerales bacterium]
MMKIGAQAVVLVDVDLRRVAIQAPNDDQAGDARTISYSCSRVGSITITTALRSLGIRPAEFGPREIEILAKGPMLIIPLIDAPGEKRGATPRGVHISRGGIA